LLVAAQPRSKFNLPLVKIASAPPDSRHSRWVLNLNSSSSSQNYIERLGLCESFLRVCLARAATFKSLVIPPHGIQNELFSSHLRILPSLINNLDTAIALIEPRQRISWSMLILSRCADTMERTLESIGREMHEHITDVAYDRGD
jgi:hypothetical protein